MPIPEYVTEKTDVAGYIIDVPVPVREGFYDSIEKEQLLSLGLRVEVVASEMIPRSSGDDCVVLINAVGYPEALGVAVAGSRGIWEVSLGSCDTTGFIGFALTRFMLTQMMLESLPGEQMFQSSWHTRLVLPADAELSKTELTHGLNWRAELSERSHLNASVSLDETQAIQIDEDILATEDNITTTPEYLLQALSTYKAFKIEYSLPSSEPKLSMIQGTINADFSPSFSMPLRAFPEIPLQYDENGSHLKLTISPKLGINTDVGWRFYRDWNFPFLHLDRLWARMDFQISIGIKFEANASLALHKSWSLYRWQTTYPFYYGVPVWINLVFTVGANLEIEGSMQLVASAVVRGTLAAGVEWDHVSGWNKISDRSLSAELDDCDWQTAVSISITPSIDFRVELLFYGIAGPFVRFTPYVTMKGNAIVNGLGGVLDCDITASLSISAGITFSGWLRTILRLGDWTWPLVNLNFASFSKSWNYTSPPPPAIPVHDMMISGLAAPPSVIVANETGAVNVNVTVRNNGDYDEIAQVALSVNDSMIAQWALGLISKADNVSKLTWNTNGLAPGSYVLKAHVSPVSGENNTADNEMNITAYVVAHNDISIFSIRTDPDVTYVGDSIRIEVTVRNLGEITEDSNVTLSANQALIGTLPVAQLAASESSVIAFLWNTTHSSPGYWVIWANASSSQYDIDITNNVLLSEENTIEIKQHTYVEAAVNKPQMGGSWSEIVDPPSLSGVVMEASDSSPNGGCLFGPYVSTALDGESMHGKPYVATYKLKVSSNLSNDTVVHIDVGYDAGHILQSKQIRASDFAYPDIWQDFNLTFIVPNTLTAGLEFRLVNRNNGVADVFADKIAVYRGWDAPDIYCEGAYNKPLDGGSWSTMSDPSSWSGIVMKASSSSLNGGCLFGPYITVGWDGQSMLSKPYKAIFRLRTTDNTSQSSIARIDVCYNAGTIIQSMTIKASDFTSSSWQDFQLTFLSPSSVIAGLEFRIINLNNGVADIFADWIVVQKEYDSSTCYIEAAYNKQQSGGSWSRINDQTSYSGLVSKAQAASPNGGCIYGPYITTDWSGQTMLGKPFAATFRLKTSSASSSNDLVNIDVCYNAGTILQSVTIKANDFATPNTWQDFNVSFIAPKSVTHGLEFRVKNLNNGLADVYVDCMSVDRQWNASSIYVEAAYNKQQTSEWQFWPPFYGSSWARVLDPPSASGLVMKASENSTNGGCLFGPYVNVGWDQESMLGRAYVASFRLKVSSNMAGSDVVSIDVACNAGSVLQSMRIKAMDFASSDTWQDFRLTFIVPSSLTNGLEFRVTNLNHGTTDIFADCISITLT